MDEQESDRTDINDVTEQDTTTIEANDAIQDYQSPANQTAAAAPRANRNREKHGMRQGKADALGDLINKSTIALPFCVAHIVCEQVWESQISCLGSTFGDVHQWAHCMCADWLLLLGMDHSNPL
jgi:hypothetical protein